MILSNTSIREALLSGKLIIDTMPPPQNGKTTKAFDAWAAKHLQPASIDLTLGPDFWIEQTRMGMPVNPRMTDLFEAQIDGAAATQFHHVKEDTKFSLRPRGWCLGRTMESVTIPNDMVGIIFTRSTAGRWGFDMRRSAGYVDPGYSGPITLEIHNDSGRYLPLYPGRRYCQLVLMRLDGQATYSGDYKVGNQFSPAMMLPKPLTD